MREEIGWSIAELSRVINETIRTDKDFFIGIDGETGMGKSTLSIEIARKVCPWFNMKTDMVYSREELIARIYEAPHFTAIIVDEAINALFKRDFMKKEQKDLLRAFDMCRDRHLIVILNIPVFWAIDKHLLESKVKMRINVQKTGFSFLFRPTKHPFSQDPWARQYNLKVCTNWDYYPNATRMLGFLGILKFGDLPSGIRDEYLKVRNMKKEAMRRRDEELEKQKKEEHEKDMIVLQAVILQELIDNDLLRPGALTTYAHIKGMKAPTFLSRRISMKARGLQKDIPLDNIKDLERASPSETKPRRE